MRSWSSARAAALAVSLVALFGGPATLSAQGSATVQGTVTDSVGRRPVPGVQVSIAGTTRGAMTDDAGRYVIRGVPAGAATVRAQRLGFAAAERSVTVGAGETVTADFTLHAVATILSEVVVTGYGTTSRAEVSSAVAQVAAEAIRNAPVAGVDAALQGKAPGVQVVQNAGNPGNGITVRVRGAASISASNQPLYVIDGVPMLREDFSQLALGGQDLTAVTGISPDDIETIDVLKDAAAAAIYGSRGANGVIMITTKRGRPGAARYTINAYLGQQKIQRKLDLMTAREYMEFRNEARTNDGRTPLFTQAQIDAAVNTDWQSEVLQTAPIHDVALGVTGGSERAQYSLMASNFDQEGIVRSSGYDRQTVRVNADFLPATRFSLRSTLALSREQIDRVVSDNTIEGPIANAIAIAPYVGPFRANGEYTDASDGLPYANPVAIADLNNVDNRTMRALGSLEAMYDITDRIRLNGRASGDIYNLREHRWDASNIPGTVGASGAGVSRLGTSMVNRWITEAFVTYDPIRRTGQRLTLTAGTSLELNNEEYSFIRGEGFATDQLQWPQSAAQVTAYDGFANRHNLVSYFGRANFSFLDRYLATASFRADGSSRFGQNSRYGYFPAVSVGWVVSDEPFMTSLKRVADFKLRASYGATGNQGIDDDFAYLGRFESEEAKYNGEAGIAPENFPNPDLKWESTTEWDIGFDLSFFNGRIALVGDVYNKKTSDLLVERPVTSTSGFTDAWDNIGNMTNRGVELQINTINFASQIPGGFEWRTDFNISHNKNKVTALFNDQPFNDGIDDINRVQVGAPIGAFHTLRFDGVDPQTGNAIFFDANGDGTINGDDRVIVGSPHPEYWGGFRNTFGWRGFDLNTFLEFSQGGEIYNGVRSFADDGGRFGDNKYRHALRRWRAPGDQTDVPRASSRGFSDAATISSRYVEDASYVRLQEVTVGYRLPRFIAAQARLSEARLYVTGRNLKLWTDYMGYDPDVNSGGSGENTFIGNDFYAYPRARTISIGLSGTW